MAVRAVEIVAAERLARTVTIGLRGTRVGVVLVFVVAEMLGRRASFVSAIASYRRPGELKRQQNQHEDREPPTHGKSVAATGLGAGWVGSTAYPCAHFAVFRLLLQKL